MKLIRIEIMTFILICAATSLSAQESYSDFDLRSVLLHNPRYLREVSSSRQLIDSLSSTSMPMRGAAIIRLTELRDSSAVPALIKVYENEPYIPAHIFDAGPGLKYFVLRALGRIGGSAAYKYLKQLSYQLPYQYRQIEDADGDPFDVYWGLFDALARLEPADSAGIYYDIYNQNELDHFIRRFAYEAYERINLKDRKYASLQDSVYYLLDTSKRINMIRKLDDSLKPTSEFIMKKALEVLTVKYASHDPAIIDRYKSGLSGNDPFAAEIDVMRALIR